MSSTDAALEDRLRELEPPYRSRGEAKVGRLLDRYGIPFFYEMPLIVLDRGTHRRWHPDFTLPSYGSLVVEYAGMPDVPEYMAGIRYKRRVFEANGIQAVFLYPQDIAGPGWEEEAIARIDAAGTRTGHGLPYYTVPHRAYSQPQGSRYIQPRPPACPALSPGRVRPACLHQGLPLSRRRFLVTSASSFSIVHAASSPLFRSR